MKRRLFVSLIAAAAFSMFASTARAATLTYDINFLFNGDQSNSSGTFATAVFDDGGGTGTVTLTITSSLEAAGEFISQFYFNSSTSVSVATNSCTTCVVDGVQPYSSNAYQADGDGQYDVRIDFDTANAGRFNGTDVAVFTITGTGITANTFAGLSASGGGEGEFYTAIHIQGITDGSRSCSGWAADRNGGNVPGGGGNDTDTTSCGTVVPDSGSTLSLLGLAMLGVGYLRARRRS